MPKACPIRTFPLSPAGFCQSHNSRLMATPSLYSYLIMLQDCNRNGSSSSNSCSKYLQGQQLLLPVAFPRKLTSQGSAPDSRFPPLPLAWSSHCHSPFSFAFAFTCISLIQLQTALALWQRAMINVHLISI